MIAVPGGSYTDRPQMSQKQNTTPKELIRSVENASDVDRIRLPPLKAEFFSPKRDFRFIVSTRDNWKSMRAYGKLVQLRDKVSELVWEKELPQEYGPRYVVVGQRGEVLMLDEWINVKSKYAIVVVNLQNDLIIQYTFDKVQEVLNVPASVIIQKAVQGSWWISGSPSLDKLGLGVYVPTADKILRVDLNTGELLVIKSIPT
ncbi:hypothetical protein [Okeania hirsuta]|uniref:hypothetical protein n=1 Tax=Okeania hirsuta TaxID=1458930 RepID=UPI000F53E920|nr:hypothetical protein [Okeania hirsuta]